MLVKFYGSTILGTQGLTGSIFSPHGIPADSPDHCVVHEG